jgi:adenosylcobinamide-GDP ribazoletransferase
VGLLAAATAAVGLWLGLAPGPTAALALVAQALATGALHEDGLADSADGLWGGGTRERRLEIMRDSRIGSFGAVALVLVVLLRWSALSALLAQEARLGAAARRGGAQPLAEGWMLAALSPGAGGGAFRALGRP